MPDWKPEIRKRLANLNLSPVREAEIVEELSQHLGDRYRDAISGGATETEAYRAALVELSDDGLLSRELHKSERHYYEPVVLGTRRSNMIGDLWQDLRYGFRTSIRQPGFAAVAIITLALGIGANSAIFSVVNSVLLKPLPYKDPDKLVMLWETVISKSNIQNPVAPGNYVTWRDETRSFDGMASISTQSVSITGTGDPEKVDAVYCTDNLLTILGVPAMAGRIFNPGEAEVGNFAGVVISYGLWQRRFGEDPGLVGKSILIDGMPVEVRGVMPPSFQFPTRDYDVWLGTKFNESLAGTLEAHYLQVVARIKPELTNQQAQADLDIVATNLQEKYPRTNKYVGATINPLSEQQVGEIRPALLTLFAAAGFVLLIACANVANLLLARATSRQKEIAIRIAIGAGRFRLTRQLATESMLLAIFGGTLGLLLAFWGVKLLILLMPPNLIPSGEVSIDKRVLGFNLAASLVTGLIFGLVPALQSTNPKLSDTLKEGSRNSLGGRTGLRSALVVVELALALILMVGAGLMLNSFARLTSVSPGFNPQNVLTLKVFPPYAKYQTLDQRAAFYSQMIQNIESLPGVDSASVINGLPMRDDTGEMTYIPEGPAPPRVYNALPRTIGPDYFKTMGISLIKGRVFTALDSSNSPFVLVVNESMAQLCWPGEDPVGKRIRVGVMTSPYVTVVGEVRDTRSRLGRKAYPQVYQSYQQSASFAPGELIVRAKADPIALVDSIRNAVWQVDKDQPVSSISTMAAVMGDSVSRDRFNMLLMGIFAALAVALAGVGIYGVMSYVVAHGTREIGIRVALGAQSGDVLRLVLGKAMLMSLAGTAIGAVGAVLLTRLISKMLYGISPTDPTTFAGVAVLLIGISLFASYLPARRAARVDPMVALRYE